MVGQTKTRLSVEDLMQFDEDRWIEVVDGELVETDMTAAGFLHTIVIRTVFRTLDRYVTDNELGMVFPDGLTYILHQDERAVQHSRIPDVSFVRREDLARDFDMSRPCPGAPDLAVEVVSPNDRAAEIEAKAADYLRYGSSQVWVLYPLQQRLHVYRSADPTVIDRYAAADTLPAADLLPGLTIAVADLFVTPLG